MIRILHSVSNMDRAGIETMLMNYYRHIDRSKIQFDFLCNKKKPGAYDAEIKEMGGNIYHTPGLNPAKYPSYLKCMKKIEMLQLLLRLGTFQVSDIVYNTLGGMLGGLCYIVGKKVHERLSK